MYTVGVVVDLRVQAECRGAQFLSSAPFWSFFSLRGKIDRLVSECVLEPGLHCCLRCDSHMLSVHWYLFQTEHFQWCFLQPLEVTGFLVLSGRAFPEAFDRTVCVHQPLKLWRSYIRILRQDIYSEKDYDQSL